MVSLIVPCYNGEKFIARCIESILNQTDHNIELILVNDGSMYDRPQVDALIDSYFTEGCPQEVRTKIYAYIAVCGLLWSNWCEYKSRLGVEFGEYSLRQYRYAKDYYQLVMQRLAKTEGQEE